MDEKKLEQPRLGPDWPDFLVSDWYVNHMNENGELTEDDEIYELTFEPGEPFPEELDRFEAIENPTPEQIAEMKEWARQKAQEQREARARREAEQKDD